MVTNVNGLHMIIAIVSILVFLARLEIQINIDNRQTEQWFHSYIIFSFVLLTDAMKYGLTLF